MVETGVFDVIRAAALRLASRPEHVPWPQPPANVSWPDENRYSNNPAPAGTGPGNFFDLGKPFERPCEHVVGFAVVHCRGLADQAIAGFIPEAVPEARRRGHILTAPQLRMPAGYHRSALRSGAQDWRDFEGIVSSWLDQTATVPARASLTACSVIGFEAAAIDGPVPAQIRAMLVGLTRACPGQQDQRAVIAPRIKAGSDHSPLRPIATTAVSAGMCRRKSAKSNA